MGQEEHDANVQNFMDMVSELRITLNHDKSVIHVESINLLGYCISYKQLKPDPERFQPLLDLPPPNDKQSLKRTVEMFSYYSYWIYQFSEKSTP